MAIDADFLNSVFANESESVESKVQQIITEYNADINGLKTKNQELIGKEKSYKEQIKGFEEGKTGFEKQIADLTKQIESKSDEKTKEYYEAREKDFAEKFNLEKQGLLDQIKGLNEYKLKDIKSKAIADGIKDLHFVNDTMKEAFLALAQSRETFEPVEIEGQTLFLNRDKKQMSDVLKDLALSEVGRQFIANGSYGGGGVPNANKGTGFGVTENPFKTGDLDAQMKLYGENKPLAVQLAKEAGVNLE